MREFSSPLRSPTGWNAKSYGGAAAGSRTSAGSASDRELAANAASVRASKRPDINASTRSERSERSGARRTGFPRVGASAGFACVGTCGIPTCKSVSNWSGATCRKSHAKRLELERPFAHAPTFVDESAKLKTRDPPGRTSAAATLHCLTGCAIGEVLGLMIGVTLQLGVTLTITLAVMLAFIIGISLAVRPLMQDQNLKLIDALRIVWVAEIISIGVMELAMNWVDFYIGGIAAPSIFSSIFWIGIMFAIPAGFIAAWPVNYVLLRMHLKSCH